MLGEVDGAQQHWRDMVDDNLHRSLHPQITPLHTPQPSHTALSPLPTRGAKRCHDERPFYRCQRAGLRAERSSRPGLAMDPFLRVTSTVVVQNQG